VLEEPAKGVYRIEDAYTNWYLVEGSGRFTVVDCGVRASWSSLHAALRELDAAPGDIEAAILTHAHFDHTGFAERLRRAHGVPVWVHENDVPLTLHPLQYAHERMRLPYLLNPRALPIAAALISKRAFWPTPIKEVTRFTDGTLPVPGSPVVIPTPGHTMGHVSFHFPDRDALIAGDAFVTLNPYTGGIGPQIVPGAATADSVRALASLDALEETGATVVLTGHGEPWTSGVAAAVDLARAAGPS
jgi:glyoxylase-like metal-dependent hydrolase (beta-lactamase superfamily II)